MIDPENLEDHILFALRRMSRAIDLRSRTLLHEFGLTAPQLSTLRVVERSEPVTASRIAQSQHLGQPTVTGILNRLESRGYLRRVRGDHDRRSVSVTLTDAGRDMLRKAPSLLPHAFQQELKELRGWERTQVLSTFERVADMMETPARAKKTATVVEPQPAYDPVQTTA